ncbi:hypothetical protein B0T22DRAFT_186069 [Podospora appendiculata]|uniref:Secreted protein n=1 Tax=Podospora appendiculata TaxID=314037 RepID=A0AAE0XCG2_9PEZI|nr:hypothetical protein B0T22DRAFT_186069 [Podospora appendiculata]
MSVCRFFFFAIANVSIVCTTAHKTGRQTGTLSFEERAGMAPSAPLVLALGWELPRVCLLLDMVRPTTREGRDSTSATDLGILVKGGWTIPLGSWT